jgi:ppGpp synthetase/RelA/SpoT-type nucleotidyltranferase
MNASTFDEAEFSRLYDRSFPGLKIGARRVVDIVREVVSATEQQRLARAKIIDEPRIKDPGSLRAKAARHGWSASEAIRSCDDMVGVRVVCNNTRDVQRFVDLLVKRLALETHGPLGADAPLQAEVQDYVAAPKPDGYRGVHLTFRVHVPDGTTFGSIAVGCEVQVRTLMQDGWARLSHKDVYKTDDLPDDLRARFEDLSRVLEAADEIAQDIRDRIVTVRQAPEERPDLTTVTEDGISYLFASTFGKNPPEYVMRLVKSELKEHGVQSLQELEALLADSKLRARIEQAYTAAFHGRGTPSAEDSFVFLAVGAARGAKEAVREARRRGKAEWEYIDAIWRSEVGAELPSDPGEFLAELESGELSVERLADLFGATSECAICAADIVDAEAFEEGASNHYNDHDFGGRVSQYVYGCGVDTGGLDNSSVCSYHDYVMSKDD